MRHVGKYLYDDSVTPGDGHIPRIHYKIATKILQYFINLRRKLRNII